MTSRHQLLRSASLAVALSIGLGATSALAQERTYSFDIPAESLSKALRDYGRVTHQQLLFTEDLTVGKTAPALQGALGASDALQRLLADSGLQAVRTATGALVIQRGGSQSPPGAADAPAASDAGQVAEVVVTGTLIRGVAPVGSPLVQVGQQAIQDRGVTTTAGLLATIPQLESFASRPVPVAAGNAPTTPPSLRNLGPGATLSLLNSHRMVGIGTLSTVADPTSLPIAAIARVEVVADGASATYGSDAVGGVVNVILRKDLNGVDARTSQAFGDGYREQFYSVVGGKTWDTGSVLLGVQYQHNSALLGRERDYITENFLPIGADSRTRSTAQPNVTVGGATYGFNGSSFNTAANLTSAAQEGDLIPASRKWSGVLSWEQRLGANIRLFGDANYGDLHTVFRLSPASDTLSFTLPSSNPFFQSPVPGQTSVAVQQGAYELLGKFHDNIQDLKYWGVSGGAEVDFTESWSGQVVSNYGHSHSLVDQDVFDNQAFQDAVNSTDPATAYDPFTGRTSAATRARITDSISAPGSTQTLFQTTAAVNGSLFTLPGGEVKLAFGGEYRRETYEGFGLNGKRSAPTSSIVESKRNVWSGYGELFLPLIGEANNIPLVRKLELNAAVRHDRYSDFGKTTNPKVGANWELVEGLTLRGTYGKSFHAPSLGDLKAIDDIAIFLPQTLLPGVLNAPGSTTPQNVILLAGGNANLKPETAKTFSVGAEYKPTFAPGLRTTFTYFDIDYTDRVVVPVFLFWTNQATIDRFVTFRPTEAQIDAVLATGLAPQGAPRFAPGQTDLMLDARRANLGGVHLKGLDFGVSYAFNLLGGRTVADLDGTHTFSKKSVTVPGTTPVDDLLTTATPATRFRAHLGWQSGALRANAFWTRLSGYNDTHLSPARRVGTFNPVDINLALKVPNYGFGKRAEIQFDVQNLFNEDPPRLYSGNGASPLSSPIGRLFQVSLRAEF